jgi:alkylated DNA repair dioxygenase AlkB
MDLIEKEGCIVKYYGKIYSNDDSKTILSKLLDKDDDSISWDNESVSLYGKVHELKRKTAYWGDEGLEYRYSGKKAIAKGWNETVFEIKQAVEKVTGETFNFALGNFYHDGTESLGYHSDSEKDIVSKSVIASVSFGAERDFLLKHNKTKEIIKINLEHGSLLTMGGNTQQIWKHSVPSRLKIGTPRVNITFRKIIC